MKSSQFAWIVINHGDEVCIHGSPTRAGFTCQPCDDEYRLRIEQRKLGIWRRFRAAIRSAS